MSHHRESVTQTDPCRGMAVLHPNGDTVLLVPYSLHYHGMLQPGAWPIRSTGPQKGVNKLSSLRPKTLRNIPLSCIWSHPTQNGYYHAFICRDCHFAFPAYIYRLWNCHVVTPNDRMHLWSSFPRMWQLWWTTKFNVAIVRDEESSIRDITWHNIHFYH